MTHRISKPTSVTALTLVVRRVLLLIRRHGCSIFILRSKANRPTPGIEPEKGINAIMLAAQALTALPAYGRLDEETTLNIGQIEGGAATNIVAEQAKFDY